MVSGFTLGGMAEGLQARRQQGLQEQRIEQQQELGERRLGLQEERLGLQRRLGERRLGMQEQQMEQQRRQSITEQADARIAALTDNITAIAEQGRQAGKSPMEIGRTIKPLQERVVSLSEAAGRDPEVVNAQINATVMGPTPTQVAEQEGRADAARISGQASALRDQGVPEEQARATAGIEVPEQSGSPIDFGGSFQGNVTRVMTQFAPGFAAGRLTPDQERAFLAAVNEARQSEQFTDPDTGLIRTRRPELPGFVTDAFEQRGMAFPDDVAAQPEAQDGQQQPLPQQAPDAATPQEDFPTLPEDAVIPGPQEAPEQRNTLFEEVAAGNVTGPIPALGRFAARIPGLGIRAPEMTQAGQLFPLLRNRLVKALQTNPRFAVAERQDIIEDLSIDPQIIDQPQTFIDRMIGIDRSLEEIEQEMRNVVTGDRSRVSGETRQHAMDTLQSIQNFRNVLSPPRINSTEEAREFVGNNPSGTKFVAQDNGGNWKVFEVE